MLKMARNSRTGFVASILGVLMFGLVLCPCPSMFAPASEGAASHGCCAGAEGLSAVAASCCASHEGSERSGMVTAPPSPAASGPAVGLLAGLPVPVAAAPPPERRALVPAPLVLRI